MRNRAWRRFQDERVVENRIRFVKDAYRGWPDGRMAEEFIEKGKGRWKNHHPFDCGKPQCRCCHYEKYVKPELSHKDQRAAQDARQQEEEI